MNLSGYHVPAGTSIMRLGQVTSNQEKYFQDTAKFMPERWLRYVLNYICVSDSEHFDADPDPNLFMCRGIRILIPETSKWQK